MPLGVSWISATDATRRRVARRWWMGHGHKLTPPYHGSHPEQWIERETHSGALELLLRREAAQQELAEVLTPRELELVRMSTTGLSNRQMAAQLGITEGTIKIHLHNIYHKLKINSRLELVLLAQSKGLL